MTRVRRLGLRLLVLLGVAAIACAAAPAAQPPPMTIAAGVTVGGIPVGGFTSEPARELVRDASRRGIRFALDGRTWKASVEQLGAGPDVDRAIGAALRARTGADIPVRATVDDAQLARYVRHLDRVLSRPARDAAVIGVDARLKPRFSAPVPGRKLDRPATAAAITDALGRPASARVRPVFRPLKARRTAANFGPVVVIRRESKELVLYSSRRVVRRLPIATGQAQYPTPLGTFSIVDMQRNPWWRPPDSDWAQGLEPIPPGPGNPLGTRWMGISSPGVGIHGTPDPASIGYSASHGCIRMRIPDAEWLFQHVRLGTPVVIVSA